MRDRTKTKGRHTGRGDNEDNNYAPLRPELEAVAALSDSEPAIPFAFEGKEDVATLVGYNELAFSFLSRGCILVLIHWCQYQQRRDSLGGV